MKERIKHLIKINYQQVLFVFLAFLAMVLVSYFYVSNIVSRQMLALGEETMNTMQESVAGSLTGSELVFSNVIQNVETMLIGKRSNEAILEYLRATNTYFAKKRSAMSDFLKIYAYIRGEFLDGSGWVPPVEYSPPSRPWHIGALKSGDRMFLSDPYVDAETGGMCITFSQQVFDSKGQPLGIVALDIKLDRVTDYISGQKIANDGYGVLLDDKMCFATHPYDHMIGQKMGQAGDGYSLLAQILANQKSISAVRFTDMDGTDSIAFFRTIFNGWNIGIVIPYSSYYAQVRDMGIVLGILGFALMITLSYILVRIRAEKIRSDEESRSKSNFLAGMSHEIRTPMNAVIGMTEIARNTNDPGKIQYCLSKISNAANHLLGVINDVLDMSKIEAGKLELSETEFVFTDMLEQVSAVVDVRIDEKHQKFIIDLDPGIPKALISDRQRLAQVITNLIGNANKFTPEGGTIKLTVRKESESGGKCRLRVEVSDNGIGISKEQQSRLFKSFVQADGSISRKYGGTGLGLTISKQIVNLMNGEIWIESELNKGSKFIFTILAGIGNAEQSAQPDKKAAGDESYDGIFNGKRILLAEDVDINREILTALLSDTGIKIDFAENGKEAVRLFSASPNAYDMILMDVQMPEMDGYEATRAIRSLAKASDKTKIIKHAETIPIIAMTANVFKEDIDKCLEAGMNDHLAKPIEVDVVVEKIKRYCGNKL